MTLSLRRSVLATGLASVLALSSVTIPVLSTSASAATVVTTVRHGPVVTRRVVTNGWYGGYRHPGWGGYGWRGAYRPYYGYGYGWHNYNDNWGAAVAGGLVGLAAGALATQAFAPRTVVVQEPVAVTTGGRTAAWYRACAAKYHSFRASDGTYLGYDGVRHVCTL